MAWKLQKLCVTIAGPVFLLASQPASAEVLATCGASIGKTYLVEHGAQWSDDQISSGSITFTVDARGNGNVLFKDALGGVVDAAADGGETVLAHFSPDRRDFVVVVIYLATGVTESFNIITGSNGVRQVLWTTNRPSSSFISKVAAFRAVCD